VNAQRVDVLHVAHGYACAIQKCQNCYCYIALTKWISFRAPKCQNYWYILHKMN
jgi:hypothetical protein